MYKIVFNPALERMSVEDFKREYSDKETANAVLNAIADYTLMLHRTGLMNDYSNYGYIGMRGGDGWIEVEDE